jgi:hypothetical protein
MRIALILVPVLLTGCTVDAVVDATSADLVAVNGPAGPVVYSRLDPSRRTMVLAAEETVKAGFDRFLILDDQAGSDSTIIRMFRASDPAGKGAIDARQGLQRTQ